MIPLRDDVPSRTTPYVNVALIAINGFVTGLALVRVFARPERPLPQSARDLWWDDRYPRRRVRGW